MLKRFLFIVIALAAAAIAVLWMLGKSVQITPTPNPIAFVGNSTPVSVLVEGPRGAKQFRASVEQNGQTRVVFEDNTKTPQTHRAYTFDVGRSKADFLKEGPATVTLEAKANDFRGRLTKVVYPVQVILQKPSVSVDGAQHYINQGGSELVTFDIKGVWSQAGVKVGPYTATSFAMPGQPDKSNHRFSLFPFFWELPVSTEPLVFVRNAAGDQTTATFWTRIFPKKFHQSTIALSDALMQKIVGDIDPNGKIQGDLLARFLYCNRELRKQNSKQLYEMRLNTAHQILWKGPFERPPTKTESYFADRRTYLYKGKKVDEQTHLGFDLASTQHMPIVAANSGKVIWADRLGIYGNCIVVDHGYGLQTIYGHLSRIDVRPGDRVAKRQTMGLSGQTGMAGGDHLHFSMQVDGVQVNPVEWWDEHWIHDRILSKIGSGPK
jgi:murein DD-endopeptidase MepM/ murein hydrolase activator NlpD